MPTGASPEFGPAGGGSLGEEEEEELLDGEAETITQTRAPEAVPPTAEDFAVRVAADSGKPVSLNSGVRSNEYRLNQLLAALGDHNLPQ